VLLHDDSGMIRQTLGAAMHRWGVHVVTVTNAADLVEALDKGMPASAGRGVIENRHLTDVESPPPRVCDHCAPPPRVCVIIHPDALLISHALIPVRVLVLNDPSARLYWRAVLCSADREEPRVRESGSGVGFQAREADQWGARDERGKGKGGEKTQGQCRWGRDGGWRGRRRGAGAGGWGGAKAGAYTRHLNTP
jgi:hypothetical protein